MRQELIFLPVIALAAWTLLVQNLIPLRRFRAAFAGQVTAVDFAMGESATVPPQVALPNRNYMNLLEAPLLFYVVCVALYSVRAVDAVAVWLAVAYVALRIVHSLIHLTYNNVMHRLVPFGLSNVVLAAAWVWFARAIVTG